MNRNSASRPAFSPVPLEPLLVVGAVALALVLRLPGLNDGLWFDEIQTLVDYVRFPLARIVTTFDSQNQHLLYSVLARVSVQLFGESPASLRLPALGFGLASLVALVRFARRIAPIDERMIALFALVVSYHHVWFSQNGRGYTGLLFFTILATTELHALLTDAVPTRGAMIRYAIATSLAMYTHLTAGALVAAHGLLLLALAPSMARRDRSRWMRALGAMALAGLLTAIWYAPVIAHIRGTLFGPSGTAASTEWQSPLWLVAETLRGLALGVPGGWITVVVLLGVVVVGLSSYWRQDRILTGLMVLPAVLTALAVIGSGHNLWPRFFFFSAGFAVLVAVRGGFVLADRALGAGRRRMTQALAGLAVAASAVMVPRAWGPKQDFRRAAEYVDRSKTGADAVVTVDLTTLPYERYYDRPWPAVTSLDSLETVERGHRRTWVLYTFPIRLAAVQPGIWERLARSYDTAAVFPGTVGGGVVVVMVNRPGQSAESRGP
jgi:hypothetical protein